MIDLENDLRRRFDDAASDVSASPDLFDTIERRVATQGRRAAVVRIAAVLAVLGLAAVAGVAIASGGGDPDTTFATDPSASSTPSRGPGTWATMADAPLARRSQHVAVAMGDEVLVTGGYETGRANLPNDAAVYDTVADTWRTVPDPPLFPGSAEGVWTGEEVLLISAEHGPDGPTPESARKAAAFDPATDTWRELAPPPPGVITPVTGAVWTGSEMVVVIAGIGGDAQQVVVIYDLATDTWREIDPGSTTIPDTSGVVWTGTEVAVVGFAQDDEAIANGEGVADEPVPGEMVVALIDPASDTVRTLPWGPLGTRQGPAVAWTGSRIFVGGGAELPSTGYRTDGALLDPATGEWTPIADAPAPYAGDMRYSTRWTGAEVIAFGEDATPLRYDPVADVWTEGTPQPGELVSAAPTVWSAGRLVTPLGGHEYELTGDDGGLVGVGCCSSGPAGGVTYTP